MCFREMNGASVAQYTIGLHFPWAERAGNEIDHSWTTPATSYSIRGRLLIGPKWVPGAVVIEEGRLTRVLHNSMNEAVPEPVLEASLVAPGFVDLQVNGGWGVEVGEGPEAIPYIASRLPETGVTSFLPTAITSTLERYVRLYGEFHTARKAPGACPLGLHLEGPYLSPARAGAHRRDLIEAADESWLDTLLAMDGLSLMTLAPERPDAPELIGRLVAGGVRVSLGHTDASYDEFRRGADAGATLVTHSYNAMRGFQHREPGALAAALLDDRLTACLIADGVHTHPAALELALRAKGSERIVLVSDSVAATGMPPGTYPLGEREVVSDARSVRLSDGTLAGSLLTLDEAVRNMALWTSASPAEALRMAGELPARQLGLSSKGRIEPGYDADLVLLDEGLHIEATIVGGQVAYRRQ